MVDRKCKTCATTKPVDQFYARNVKGRVSYSSYCLDCYRVYQSNWYRKLSAKKKQQRRTKQVERRVALRRLMYEYLLKCACADCGEKDPIVLEFDHVKGEKENVISRMMANNTKWERVVAEIEKCQIRCANCHRRATARRAGFWRHVFGEEKCPSTTGRQS